MRRNQFELFTRFHPLPKDARFRSGFAAAEFSAATVDTAAVFAKHAGGVMRLRLPGDRIMESDGGHAG